MLSRLLHATAPLLLSLVIFGPPAYADVDVEIVINLQGPLRGEAMATDLTDRISLDHPFSEAPYLYAGPESVSSIPTPFIVDWVLLELRSGSADGPRVARRAAFVEASGRVVDLDGARPVRFSGVTPGPYFIVVWHRNHLAVVTPDAVNLQESVVSGGFENTEIFSGLAEPDALAFSPDGRMFIAERITGRLRVANLSGDTWTLKSQPFYTFDIPKQNGQPKARRSAGLRDIAFDPNFASNGFVYAFYMDDDLHNRVIRLKASGHVADAGFGEDVLIELPFNNTSSSGSHNGGAIEFGPDGKLYITTGDGWEGEFAGDPVQSLSTWTGKVLRINPDGSIPTDNPFYNQASGRFRAIYALGLRNPYSMSINPASGRLYINEARGSNKADIYIAEPGANYSHEGASGIGTVRGTWANASGAGSELITGGAWYPSGGPFPPEYHGGYFVALWGGNGDDRGQISVIESETKTSVSAFETNVGLSTDPPVKPVITRIGPDGNLYYLLTTYQTSNGTVQRVRNTGVASVSPPTFSPAGGTYADPVTVSISSATAGSQIRYTLDGSEPLATSTEYTGPINISETTLVRARAFRSGLAPSNPSSAGYTIGDGGGNIPPDVDAGEDRTVFTGTTNALDGSGTTDPDGDDDLLRDEQWTQLSGPAVTIQDPTEEIAYFTPNVAGTYVFRLEVSDGIDTGSDTVTFTVIDQAVCGDSEVVAKYLFNEGSGSTVTDVSGFGSPLNLTIESGSPAWIPGGGLDLTASTLIRSSGNATKIVNAATASDAFTIEAWVRPANVTQEGPARIVSLSGSPTTRNVMLGQGNFGATPPATFSARLRTTDGSTNDNGEPGIITPDGSAKVALQHVVYTRAADGTSVVYVDGSPVLTESVPGSLSNWAGYPLVLGNEVSGDRPWLGELHGVSMFGCALDSGAVLVRYGGGPG